MASLKNILQDKNGKVGIGTYSPSGKLHIYTSSSGATPYESDGLVIEKSSRPSINLLSTATSDAYIFFGQPANGNRGYLGYVFSSDQMQYRSTGTHSFMGGNVGIGTTSPTHKLHIEGFISTNNSSSASGLLIRKSGSTIGFIGQSGYWVGDTTDDLTLSGQTGKNIRFYTNGNTTERMRITSGGNVGIGITSPSRKLHVEGAIGVKRVSVNATSTIDMEGNFNFDASSGYSHVFKQAGSEILRITETGKMGINTTNPKGKFWVQGDTSYFTSSTNGVSSIVDSQSCAIVIGPATTRNGTAGTYMAGIGFDHLLNYTSQGNVTYSTTAGPHAWVGIRLYATPGYEQSDLVFATRSSTSSGGATAERMTVSALGNVGIGTSSPSYRLSVSGADNNIVASFDHTSFVSRQVGLPGRFMVGPLGNGYPEIGYNFTTASSTYTKIVNDTAWSINFGNNSRMSFKYAGAGTGEFSFTEHMVINTSGNVGIGTTSPSERLDVNGNIRIQSTGTARLILDGDTSNSGDTGEQDSVIDFRHDNGLYGFRLSTYNYAGTSAFDISENQNGTYYSRIHIDNAGEVGIGTTSPSHLLQVQNGNIGVYSDNYGNTGMIRLFGTDNSEKLQVGSLSSNGFLFAPDGIGLSIYTGGSENVRITSAGNVGIGTTSPSATLHISDAANSSTTSFSANGKITMRGDGVLAWGSSANQGHLTWDGGKAIVYGLSGQELHLGAGSTTNYMVITTTGNVGIGTTSPGYKLDVSGGAIAIRGNAAGNSLRFDDTTATSRNAMYVDTSNYLNIGNANYAGVKFVQTASAPGSGAFDGQSVQQAIGTTDEGVVLAAPDAWLAVRVGTTDYAIPMYTTG